jgi:hypothetical protein
LVYLVSNEIYGYTTRTETKTKRNIDISGSVLMKVFRDKEHSKISY